METRYEIVLVRTMPSDNAISADSSGRRCVSTGFTMFSG